MRDNPGMQKRGTLIVAAIAALVIALVVGGITWDRQRTDAAPDTGVGYAPKTDGPDIPEPPTLQVPEDPHVLFIGDSFTEGHGADDKKTRGFAPRLAAIRGWTDIEIDGIGLTGFLRPGHVEEAQNTYRERLQRLHDSGDFSPNLIIFQGGLNDTSYSSNELQLATQNTMMMARDLWPGVQLVLIGPMSYRTSLSPVNRAYSNAAYVARVPFIDVNTKPIIAQSDNAELTIEDGWHPNDEGHQLVAEALSTRIDELMAPVGSDR